MFEDVSTCLYSVTSTPSHPLGGGGGSLTISTSLGMPRSFGRHA